MDDDLFGDLVEQAIDSLPHEFAKRMDNVGIVVEDEPSLEELRRLGLPPWALLFGLYHGIPVTKRQNYTGVLPDKIIIYKNSILRVAQTEEDIRAQVRATVIHEIGHHFGLSDEELK